MSIEDEDSRLNEDLEFDSSQLDELWENAVDYGIWIDPGYADPIQDYEDISNLEGEVSKERLEQIENGSELSSREEKILVESWVDRVFSDHTDMDDIPAVAITPYESKWLLLSRTGWSVTGVDTELSGVFDSKNEVLNHLTSDGMRTDLVDSGSIPDKEPPKEITTANKEPVSYSEIIPEKKREQQKGQVRVFSKPPHIGLLRKNDEGQFLKSCGAIIGGGGTSQITPHEAIKFILEHSSYEEALELLSDDEWSSLRELLNDLNKPIN